MSSIRVTHTVSSDLNIKRGACYMGILNLNELKKKLKGNFSLEMASAFPMYKCFPDHEFKVIAHSYEPPDDIATRKAATLNGILGNFLLNHLPGWAVLPDRETAAMVYSDKKTANDFLRKLRGGDERIPGRTFRAIPELNSKLVIAPAAHLRYSFNYAFGAFGVTGNEHTSLEDWDVYFYQLFHAYGMEDGFPSDWQLFLTTLNDIAFDKIRPERKISGVTEIVLAKLVENKANIIDFLDNAFSPLNNGFKTINYTEGVKKEEYPDNEIWMASRCLLIDEEVFDRMGPC